jgi:hypothetical protein
MFLFEWASGTQGIPGGESKRRSRGQRDEIEVASGYYFFPGWVNGDGDSVKTVKWWFQFPLIQALKKVMKLEGRAAVLWCGRDAVAVI